MRFVQEKQGIEVRRSCTEKKGTAQKSEGMAQRRRAWEPHGMETLGKSKAGLGYGTEKLCIAKEMHRFASRGKSTERPSFGTV